MLIERVKSKHFDWLAVMANVELVSDLDELANLELTF